MLLFRRLNTESGMEKTLRSNEFLTLRKHGVLIRNSGEKVKKISVFIKTMLCTSKTCTF